MSATILVVFPLQQAYLLLDMLFNYPLGQSATIDEVGASALEEVGNILAGSYLTSLSTFTGLTFVPMVPALAVDMAGAVLDYVLAEFGQVADQVLLIETELQALGEDINSYFLVPKVKDLKRHLRRPGWTYVKEIRRVGMADLAVACSPLVLVTIGLGSCVGVALYDDKAKVVWRTSCCQNQMGRLSRI